jgi:hypothetical protein
MILSGPWSGDPAWLPITWLSNDRATRGGNGVRSWLGVAPERLPPIRGLCYRSRSTGAPGAVRLAAGRTVGYTFVRRGQQSHETCASIR